MYRLHYYPANANAAPHMVLAEIGVPYELVLVDRGVEAQKSAAYLAKNPNGRIPTLEDGDLVLSEAAAIVLHLVDHHPEAGLAPPPGSAQRARFYQWLVFLTNSLQEELMVFQYPERLVGGEERMSAAVRDGAEARASAYLDVIDKHLAAEGPYFLGAAFSAADLYLVMLARWARPMTKPPRARPAIAALLDRVVARPAVRRAYDEEGISGTIC